MNFRILASLFAPRMLALTFSLIGWVGFSIAAEGDWFGPYTLPAFVCACLSALGLHDLYQAEHSVLRNYPITAHLRFLLESVRPELRQYFIEDENKGHPFSRNTRAVVYQRAKENLDKRPFGTQLDVYAEGFEWLCHSVAPRPVRRPDFRVRVGGPDCAKPYEVSRLNISAMSFGALSSNAIRALNAGAKRGGFAHNTGEGGFSPYHRENGGDIIWEIGSGYFGCRTPEGGFDADGFARIAACAQIKMIEIKLSQGAKPGHGGVLPAAKVTAEIARIRGVQAGKDCISPAAHSAFSTPLELVGFIARLRDLSGGKPVGFKLCIGQTWEFLALCKAMLETGVYPDYIVVDGKEGGTGSAPMEFMDHLGMPMRDGLVFAHHALIGIGARARVRIGVSGKIATAFDMARAFALGADWCYSARGFMFALGCIQSLQCHTDRCPTGVATQDSARGRALVPALKAERVTSYHRSTLATLAELTAAAGLDDPGAFRPEHFYRRLSPYAVTTFAELYPAPRAGAFLHGDVDARFADAWAKARPETFQPAH